MLSSKLLTRSMHSDFRSPVHHGWRYISLPSYIKGYFSSVVLGWPYAFVSLVLFYDDRCYIHACFSPQVHFVPDAGTVAQIVYTDDQVRPPQQVVYTADGASYTSVDGPEHTLVYIHPVEAAQACEGLFLTCFWINTLITYDCYGSVVILDVVIQ